MNLGWSIAEMSETGQALGSDVPFFFFAPSAVVTGRGVQVTPVRITEHRWVVLVNPGFPIETKWAYERLSLGRPDMELFSDPFALSGVGEHSLLWGQILKIAENDFEVPVFAEFPVLREIKQMLLAQGAEVALLSGSGATVFGVFPDEAKAQQACAHYQNNPRFKVFAVPTRTGPLNCQT